MKFRPFLLPVFLLLFLSLTSCSLLTRRGRQEYAYRRYVRKASVVRARQQRKFHFRIPDVAIRQDAPRMTVERDSPQSVTAAPSASEQSPAAEQAPPAAQSPN